MLNHVNTVVFNDGGGAAINTQGIIDAAAISAKCDELVSTAEIFNECRDLVQLASDTCTMDALSVSYQSLQPLINDLADALGTYHTGVDKVAEAIKGAAWDQRKIEIAKMNSQNSATARPTSNGQNDNVMPRKGPSKAPVTELNLN